jgi:hypothetical protein
VRLKRLFTGGAAVALAFGLTAITAGPASAALPKHDASNDAVTCNDLIGKIKFSVPLTLGGTSANQITLTVKSDDCTDTTAGVYDASTNPGGVSLKSGAGKGILNSTTNDCLGLQGLSTGVTGNVFISWATLPGTPALNNTAPVSSHSTFAITQDWGGTYNDGGQTSPTASSDSWGAEYGFFAIGGATSGLPKGATQSNTTNPTMTGAFTGGDSGHNSEFQGNTNQTTAAIGAECLAGAVKGITFGIGGFTFK